MRPVRVLAASFAAVVVGTSSSGAPARAPVASAAPEGISGAGTTGIAVVNLDLVQQSAMTVDFYRQPNGEAIRLDRGPVSPGGLDVVYLPAEPALANGAYAVAIKSNRPLGVTAVTTWPSTGGQAAYGGALPGGQVIVPVVTKGYRNQTSVVSIQNTDSVASATVHVELVRAGEAMPVVRSSYPIEPGTSLTLDLSRGDFVDVPDGTVGLMRVTSATPVAVQVLGDVERSQGVYGYDGVPGTRASDRLLAPLIHAGRPAEVGSTHTGARDSWLAVANAGAGPADVTVTYRGIEGPCAGTTVVHGGGPRTIAGGSMVLLDAGAEDSGLPDGCRAAATVTADVGRLVGAVVDVAEDGLAGAYAMVPVLVPGPGPAPIHLPQLLNHRAGPWAAAAAPGGWPIGPLGRTRPPTPARAHARAEARVPLQVAQAEPVPRAVSTSFRNAFASMTTGLAVMNAGDETAEVRLRLIHVGGHVQTCDGCFAAVEPGAAHHFWFGDLDDVEPGEYGHLWVEGTAPLAVVSYDYPLTGANDMLMFNGLPVPGPDGVAGTHEGWVPLALK